MSTQQAAARIGKLADLTIEKGQLQVLVTVLDHKNVYGDDRWLVTPEWGSGSIWVSGNRVKFITESEEK